MSASDIFSIGRNGLRTYQSQLSTISQNITNAGSENYTRRMTVVRESSVSTSTQVLYKQSAIFGGSEVGGIYRVNDPLLDEAARQSSGTLSNADSTLTWMNNIEGALNDTDDGVGTTLTSFYTSVERLAANPTNASLRSDMLYQLNQTVAAFNQTADSLSTNLENMKKNADSSTSLLNTALDQLQDVNQAILRTQEGTTARAALEDTRDGLIGSITDQLNASVDIGANGVATISYGGTVIADATTHAELATTQGTDGTLTLTVNGANVATPTNGSLAGIMSSATVAQERLDELDDLAVQFASQLNDWHAQGQTDDGSTGGDLLSIGTTAASMSVAITDTDDFAVATSDGRNNGNLLDLSSIRETDGIEDQWTKIVTKQGNLVATAATKQEQAEETNSAAQGARDAISGVNLDQEAADLLRVQQAYQASAKIIQAARDIVDSILSIN